MDADGEALIREDKFQFARHISSMISLDRKHLTKPYYLVKTILTGSLKQ